MVDTPAHIKLAKSYLGAYDFDSDGGITPTVVAVSDKALEPYRDVRNGNLDTHVLEGAPVLEIEHIKILTGRTPKVRVTFSNKGYLDVVGKTTDTITTLLDSATVDEEGYSDGLESITDEEIFTIEELDADTKLQALYEHFKETKNTTESTKPLMKQYSIDLPLTLFITFFTVNMSGETYIHLFDPTTKPANINTTILNENLHVVVALPEQDTEEYTQIITVMSEIVSETGLKAIHDEIPEDIQKIEAYREARDKVFLTLTKIGSGSVTHLKELYLLGRNIDEYYQRVILSDSDEEKPDDLFYDALIEALEYVAGFTNINIVFPPKQSQQEVQQFQSDFEEFNNLIKPLATDPAFEAETEGLVDALSFYDHPTITNEGEPDPNGVIAWIASKMSPTSLPENMVTLADTLDENGFFKRSWNAYSTLADFMEDPVDDVMTLGSKLVNTSIAGIVRLTRLTSQHGGTFLQIFSPAMGQFAGDEGIRGNLWAFKVFSEELAHGDTETFKQFLCTPSINYQSAPLEEQVANAPLGSALVGFVKALLEEEWSIELLDACFGTLPTISTLVKDCLYQAEEFSAQLKETGRWDSLASMEGGTDAIYQSLAAQVVVKVLDEYEIFDTTLDEIAGEFIAAMDSVADVNTGKSTTKAFNSSEWINIKESYFTGVLMLDNKAFFRHQ